jgi:ATP-dependent Clp protease ATP-binding subunit ClpC
VAAIESRLSAIEERVGTGPDASELDQQIDQARRDREAAASAQDYENAAVLRDREKQLAAEKASLQQQWAAAHMDLPAMAEEVHRLSGEIERLGGLPRQQDTGPQDGAA